MLKGRKPGPLVKSNSIYLFKSNTKGKSLGMSRTFPLPALFTYTQKEEKAQLIYIRYGQRDLLSWAKCLWIISEAVCGNDYYRNALFSI